jgi:hypothetical protein
MRQVMQRYPVPRRPRFNFRDQTTGLIGLCFISTTTTVGSVGEVITSISSNLTTGNFKQHRFAIQSQGQPIAVAQAPSPKPAITRICDKSRLRLTFNLVATNQITYS